jgi:tRNA G26 N,N-dimethylase Trm1
MLSMESDHFYKIFFRVEESRTQSLELVKKHRYYKWDKKTQEFELSEFEKDKSYFGKTYVGDLHNKNLIEKMISNLDLIKENKKVTKLLETLHSELNTFCYYNIHKLEKEFKFSSKIRYEQLFEELKAKKFKVSRAHGNVIGIKTNSGHKELIKIMKLYKN